MKTLYLDCSMGASGDMITSALLELLPNKEEFIKKLNSLGLPKIKVKVEKVNKCGIMGTQTLVTIDGKEDDCIHNHIDNEDCELHHHHHHHHEHDDHHEHNHEHQEHQHEHHHEHASMDKIHHIVLDHMELPNKVKQDVINVYEIIAKGESHVHNVPISDIHFHEVGTMDAIFDISAVCLLINEINPERIIVSPICTGSGYVKCAHGILPVPAPATAYILQDIPIYMGSIKDELCTPTGAALLKYFATSFSEMPVMKVDKIGYGMGKKDFEIANCLRAFLGQEE